VRNIIIADGQWARTQNLPKISLAMTADAKELKALVSLVALISQTDLLLLQTDIAAIFHFSNNNSIKIANFVRHLLLTYEII